MLLISFTLIHDLVPINALFLHTLVFLVYIKTVFLIVELALNPSFPFIRISIDILTSLFDFLLGQFSHINDFIQFGAILLFELFFLLL